MRFFTTYGVEFTYILPDIYYKSGTEDELIDCHCDVMKQQLRQWNIQNQLKALNFLEIHNDCGALEIDSPIFKKWSEVKRFYNEMSRLANKMNLVTHREASGGGGGHIHAGIPKNMKSDFLSAFIINLYRDISNRPYLNSLFNEYADDHTSCHPCKSNIHRKLISSTITDMVKAKEILNDRVRESIRHSYYFNRCAHNDDRVRKHILKVLECYEGYINIQDEYKTLEFRIFDMPKSLERLRGHIDFIDAYLRYIQTITKNKLIIPTECRTSPQWRGYRNSFKDIDKTKKEFQRFLRTLGLPYRQYAYLLQENFINRIEGGYKIN